jgi:hypothetical protein
VRKKLLNLIIVVLWCILFCSVQSPAKSEAKKAPAAPGIVYSNPRVYNVDYTFEMVPDPNNIDRTKDLKVWIPIPREWDSQKAVKIISVQPEPQARYVDPEYGNPMLFYDFGKGPEPPSYKVDIKFRLESYQINVQVDPQRVGSYDKTSEEYTLYTRNTHTIHITPKIKELAQEAIGDETNPYLQAERIVKYVGKKIHYKILDFERGRGIDCLLAYPVIDKETGQEYYEGCCNQITALIVALCRAVGIPARCVSGYIGWNPWIDPKDVKAKYPFETKLSPGSLAATQFYGMLSGHMWGEFFIPSYGWIPADTVMGVLPYQSNQRWIRNKGRDIRIEPFTPGDDSEGYGSHWVALYDGRADSLSHAVLNIGKVHTSKVTVLHHSDPFPADGLASYPGDFLMSRNAKKDLRYWRQGVLSWSSRFAHSSVQQHLNMNQKFPHAMEEREAFVCHILRRQLGDDKFFKLVKTYVNLRQKSGRAIPISRFQELAENISGQSLDWFFDQWANHPELLRLKLEKVIVNKVGEGWKVQGRLEQLGNTIFQLPIEIALDTKKGREKQKVWIEKQATDFEFCTLHEPRKLVVDPDYEILKLQKMPPRLWWYNDLDPEYIVIYGTLMEAPANESLAVQFARDDLGYGREIVKADVDVNDTDLKTKCIFLIGRPQTNKIAQQFKDSFPIKFDGAMFTWQGIAYNKPTQGLGQIIENPNNAQGLIIMYVGLSPEVTLKLYDLEWYDSDSSYVIFDDDEQLLAGDWEDMDSNLYWKFNNQ